MPEMRSVFSSMASALGFDEEKGELHVTFANGKTAIYHDVPPDVAKSVLEAPSIGEALHANIRGQYRHSYRNR